MPFLVSNLYYTQGLYDNSQVMLHINENVSLRRTHWNSFCPAECVYECKKLLNMFNTLVWVRPIHSYTLCSLLYDPYTINSRPKNGIINHFPATFSHLFHLYETQRDKNCFNVFAKVRPFHGYVTWLFSYNHCVYNKFKAQKLHFQPLFQPLSAIFYTHLHTQREKNCFNVFAGVRHFRWYVTWLLSYNPWVL